MVPLRRLDSSPAPAIYPHDIRFTKHKPFDAIDNSRIGSLTTYLGQWIHTETILPAIQLWARFTSLTPAANECGSLPHCYLAPT